MDVSVQYVNPVKEDLIKSKDYGLLLGGKSKPNTSSIGSLAAEIESALVYLSISAPALEDRKASVVEKDKEGGEVFAQKEKNMGVKVAANSELIVDEELRNSKCMASSEAYVNEKKKTPDIAAVEKPTLQASLKLVSALKGSREKQGKPAEKMSVTWAADVYDPPVTSQSHTVTDNNHGSSTSKKSYRNKNKHKAKSNRKNNNDKKKSSKISRNSSKVASY